MPRVTRELLTDIVEKHPVLSLRSLENQLRAEKIDFSEDELLSMIRVLQTEGIFLLHLRRSHDSFLTYLSDYSLTWPIYLAIAVSFAETLLVIGEPSIPLGIIVRSLIGIALLGFIPGFFTAQAIFARKKLSILEWTILSIFLSVVISTGTGILLGLRSYFQPAYTTLALSLYTDLFALASGYRAYLFHKRTSIENQDT